VPSNDHPWTHLDEKGRLKMVDVSEKAPTWREAKAVGRVRMAPETLRRIQEILLDTHFVGCGRKYFWTPTLWAVVEVFSLPRRRHRRHQRRSRLRTSGSSGGT
jgi:hypothetical protein